MARISSGPPADNGPPRVRPTDSAPPAADEPHAARDVWPPAAVQRRSPVRPIGAIGGNRSPALGTEPALGRGPGDPAPPPATCAPGWFRPSDVPTRAPHPFRGVTAMRRPRSRRSRVADRRGSPRRRRRGNPARPHHRPPSRATSARLALLAFAQDRTTGGLAEIAAAVGDPSLLHGPSAHRPCPHRSRLWRPDHRGLTRLVRGAQLPSTSPLAVSRATNPAAPAPPEATTTTPSPAGARTHAEH